MSRTYQLLREGTDLDLNCASRCNPADDAIGARSFDETCSIASARAGIAAHGATIELTATAARIERGR